MSFIIDLYQTTSPANKVDKDISIVLDNVSGTLRKGTSIIDPVIVIQCDNSDQWRKQLNYARIDAFGRYYFVTNIVAVEGTWESTQYPSPEALWEIHMHVDVLMSYKEQIKKQTAVIARQEGKYNLMLDDGIFMTYQNPKLQTKLFSEPAPFETQEFILMIAGS